MKNLLHCHSIGLHSFPISFENGFYRRVFYADDYHSMWKDNEIAIHPHHVDIKITVLDGSIYNPLFAVNSESEDLYDKYRWRSEILEGNGGFELLEHEYLERVSNKKYHAGEVIIMKACELHTVSIDKGTKAVWLIEETKPTCEYFPINYSKKDLTNWNAKGLYVEVGENVKQEFIGNYLHLIQ